mmetsp:Transcript_16799/g.23784  ORF Transcript_16799/g.23784 Transcript_16799/m.23784 type:complete len:90 (+) Transcript_16799:178-447(+)
MTPRQETGIYFALSAPMVGKYIPAQTSKMKEGTKISADDATKLMWEDNASRIKESVETPSNELRMISGLNPILLNTPNIDDPTKQLIIM